MVCRLDQNGLQSGPGLFAKWTRMVCRVDQDGLQSRPGWFAEWTRMVCRVNQDGLQSGLGWFAEWTRMVCRVDQDACIKVDCCIYRLCLHKYQDMTKTQFYSRFTQVYSRNNRIQANQKPDPGPWNS